MVTDTTTFIHKYFYSQNEYSADYIDKNIDPFIVQFSLSHKLIKPVEKDGKRLYRILTEGEKILKKNGKEQD